MRLRRLLLLPVPALLLAALASAAAVVSPFDGHRTPSASADPAYGTVTVNPTTRIIIENYKIGLPVRFTTCADPLTFTGTATGGSNLILTDTGKNWTANQWANYTVDVTSGPGNGQSRKIISNTSNTLTVGTDWGAVISSGSATTGSTTTLMDAPETWNTNQWTNYLVDLNGPGGPQTRTVVSNTNNVLTVTPAWSVFASGNATSGTAETLVDTTKNWTANQWANQTVELLSGKGAPQTRQILSNTSNTLMVTTPWGQFGSGMATGGAASTLVDSAANWTVNEWAGRIVDLVSGPSSFQTATIASNTNNTMTMSSPWASGTTGTATGGSATTLVDTGASWSPNQWVNLTLELTSGAGAPQTRTVLSNTTNTITVSSAWSGSNPASGTGYLVRRVPVLGTGYQVRTGAGTATGGTSNTIADSGAAFAVNELANASIDILAGPGSPQSRTIVSNSATSIVVDAAWTPDAGSQLPGAGSTYSVRRAPAAGTSYRVREGPAASRSYSLRTYAPPASGSGYRVSKAQCYVGAYDVTVNYPSSRFTVLSDGGQSTGGNTTTTLNDTSKAWKVNQWVGTLVSIVSGPAFGQKRTVTGNTATQLVVSPPWDTTFPNVLPTSTSYYAMGGIAEGGMITSTGRSALCPGGAQYGSGTASLSCVTTGWLPPFPATGAGNLVNVSMQATGRGSVALSLTNVVIVQIDGTTIPADVVGGTWRVILCPDSSPNGVINSSDLQQTAAAFGQKGPPLKNPPDPLWTQQKDVDENGNINSVDLQLTASVFLQKCVQP